VRRILELFGILMRKENDPFEAFCLALQNSGHKGLAARLRESLKVQQLHFEPAAATNMDEARRKALENNSARLCSCLDVEHDGILPYMFRDEILTYDDFERIDAIRNRGQRVTLLLSVLTMRGNGAFDTLCQALLNNGTQFHRDLAASLMQGISWETN